MYRVGGAQGVAALAYGVEGIPAVDKIVGPGLSGVYARAGSRTSLDANAYIEQSLREPQTFLVPEYPAVMPSFDKFSDGEVLDLIAYLKTLN